METRGKQRAQVLGPLRRVLSEEADGPDCRVDVLECGHVTRHRLTAPSAERRRCFACHWLAQPACGAEVRHG